MDTHESLINTLEEKGISGSVLRAMREVDRAAFVPNEYKEQAYVNTPLPIGDGQTISEPYVVAYMTQALNLKPTDKVLEIGTGSGYQTAILSRLTSHVYSIERYETLSHQAKSAFKHIGISNITLKIADGYKGWAEYAPFDAIILTAAPMEVPEILLSELANGGRLCAPIGEENQTQILKRYTRSSNGEYLEEILLPVRFVPMLKGLG